MYKNLLIALLLVAFAPVAAHSADPTYPVIVAKRRLLNQTAPKPTTTIFTPAHDGVYRLSVYATITQADSSSRSSWSLGGIAWTDDAGPESLSAHLYMGDPTHLGPFGPIPAGLSETIEAKAGTPITYSVNRYGPRDNSVYSLYYVLEQIE
jgi:hypothetical protein